VYYIVIVMISCYIVIRYSADI